MDFQMIVHSFASSSWGVSPAAPTSGLLPFWVKKELHGFKFRMALQEAMRQLLLPSLHLSEHLRGQGSGDIMHCFVNYAAAQYSIPCCSPVASACGFTIHINLRQLPQWDPWRRMWKCHACCLPILSHLPFLFDMRHSHPPRWAALKTVPSWESTSEHGREQERETTEWGKAAEHSDVWSTFICA